MYTIRLHSNSGMRSCKESGGYNCFTGCCGTKKDRMRPHHFDARSSNCSCQEKRHACCPTALGNDKFLYQQSVDVNEPCNPRSKSYSSPRRCHHLYGTRVRRSHFSPHPAEQRGKTCENESRLILQDQLIVQLMPQRIEITSLQ